MCIRDRPLGENGVSGVCHQYFVVHGQCQLGQYLGQLTCTHQQHLHPGSQPLNQSLILKPQGNELIGDRNTRSPRDQVGGPGQRLAFLERCHCIMYPLGVSGPELLDQNFKAATTGQAQSFVFFG